MSSNGIMDLSICNIATVAAVISLAVIWAFGMNSVYRGYRGCNGGATAGFEGGDVGHPLQTTDMAPPREFLENSKSKIDYQQVIQDLALSQDLVRDHKQHVQDTKKYNFTASHGAVFDHDTSIIPWLGLRRPNFQGAKPLPTSRSVPSVYEDQIPKFKRACF